MTNDRKLFGHPYNCMLFFYSVDVAYMWFLKCCPCIKIWTLKCFVISVMSESIKGYKRIQWVSRQIVCKRGKWF
jgi:hypothetical protein